MLNLLLGAHIKGIVLIPVPYIAYCFPSRVRSVFISAHWPVSMRACRWNGATAREVD